VLTRFIQSVGTNPALAKIFPLIRILDSFTLIRAQTAIISGSGLSGIAKKGTLRTSRVLCKGLVFKFTVEVPERFTTILATTCKIARHAGSSWTRGLGEVRFSLGNDQTKYIQESNIESKLRAMKDDNDKWTACVEKNEGELYENEAAKRCIIGGGTPTISGMHVLIHINVLNNKNVPRVVKRGNDEHDEGR
jgi:hypothetical protein